jgi:2-oxoglutarate dehydrogenase E1 component
MSNDVLNLSLNLPFVDDLYHQYRADPRSVDPSWRRLFENGISHAEIGFSTAPAQATAPVAMAQAAAPYEARFTRMFALVNAYRVRGHLEAQLDPLNHLVREPHPDLDPRSYGLEESGLERVVPAGGLTGVVEASIREIIARLRATYCSKIGIEMMHITDAASRTWLYQRMETLHAEPAIDRDTQLHMLRGVAAAELFEQFCHTKFVGTKRFSLEGGETLIPLLELVIECAGMHGLDEVVLGMAHRGRLNVLYNIMGKSAGDIFAEFEDIAPETMFGGGDVKYHLGYSSDRVTRMGHKMHLSLAFNPSHLEAVDPVVVGRVRAKQRRRGYRAYDKVLGILVHGDAAFAGQGLVAEVLNLANLRGYRTGGTVHVIVNNQIGFTTAPADSRSTPYCTDVAKMTQVPIFHVNGDDPESVAQVVRIAMDYRREFRSDVVIDMYCFRKYGHNESDEPGFTQPVLYKRIEQHPTVREIYSRELIERGVVTQTEIDALVAKQHELLAKEHARPRSSRPRPSAMGGYWSGYVGGPDTLPEVDTSVPRDLLQQISERVTAIPTGFHPHPKIVRLFEQRAKMGRGELPLDWGMGELLAFGSLVWNGTLVRVSGQDSRRGTFSHRHAVIVDQLDESEYTSLEHLHERQAPFRIYDSPLSEAGVLGFEFGYSLDYPDGLVVWEAQFGDFVNGAQVIIDQFITSSEDKWERLSGLTLLLPHGFEGQGPEHSSARFERFLELCAEDNIQVCYPTTPSQYFHLLRRQVLRKWRKPLIVLTPKNLLRLPAARAPLQEFTSGHFQRILFDPEPPNRVRRIVLTVGKIYYELYEERKSHPGSEAALVRLEQLYPLPDAELQRAIEAYPQAEEIVWVQEEPANMGAERFLQMRLLRLAGSRRVHFVSRPESASPATGSHDAHKMEQAKILKQAFSPFEERKG